LLGPTFQRAPVAKESGSKSTKDGVTRMLRTCLEEPGHINIVPKTK
jgi:hypothetical protein